MDWMKTVKESKKPRIMPKSGAQTMGAWGRLQLVRGSLGNVLVMRYHMVIAWGRAQPGGYMVSEYHMISEDSGWNDITWPESIDSKEKRAEGEALNVPTLRGKESEKRL